MERFIYAFANSNIETSHAPSANVYPYWIFSWIQLKPRLIKNGFATVSHPRAVIILADGTFLLCHNAYLRGNSPENVSSALPGVSGPILNGISNIGVSIVNGSFWNPNA